MLSGAYDGEGFIMWAYASLNLPLRKGLGGTPLRPIWNPYL